VISHARTPPQTVTGWAGASARNRPYSVCGFCTKSRLSLIVSWVCTQLLLVRHRRQQVNVTAPPEEQAVRRAVGSTSDELKDLVDVVNGRALGAFRRAFDRARDRGEVRPSDDTEVMTHLAFFGVVLWGETRERAPTGYWTLPVGFSSSSECGFCACTTRSTKAPVAGSGIGSYRAHRRTWLISINYGPRSVMEVRAGARIWPMATGALVRLEGDQPCPVPHGIVQRDSGRTVSGLT
jgi:hypothetical protein